MLNIYQIIIYGVMIGAVSLLLAEYDGPQGLIKHFREKLHLPDCAGCLSVWVGAFFFILCLGNLNIIPAWAVGFLITRKF